MRRNDPSPSSRDDLGDLRSEAERQGWRVERTGSGHWRFVPPDRSKRIVITSSTPSDRQAIHRMRADLKKSGLAIAARDCGCSGKRSGASRDPSRQPKRKGGQKRMSAKGIEYTTCPWGMKIQTLLFPKKKGSGIRDQGSESGREPATYTARSAQKWAAAHKFDPRSVDEASPSAKFIRIRQYAPALFVKGSFRYIYLKSAERHGVRAIIGCPKLGIYKDKRKPKASAVVIPLPKRTAAARRRAA